MRTDLEIISTKVDLSQLPKVDQDHLLKSNYQVTIGDLHANAVKLLNFLITHGIVRLEREEDYDQFNIMGNLNTCTKEDIAQLKDILARAIVEKDLDDSLIRLIGDEVADRMTNDYFVLLILKKLKDNNVPVEILLSNHGHEFIMAYETLSEFLSVNLGPEFAASMKRLNELLMMGVVTRSEILNLIDTVYKPSLKAISYTITADQALTLHTHAPVGESFVLSDGNPNIIQALAKKLDIDFIPPISNITEIIDHINQQFHTHVMNNTVHTICTPEGTQAVEKLNRLLCQKPNETNLKEEITEICNKYPLEFLIWNRSTEFLIRPDTYQEKPLDFSNGHTTEKETPKNVHNLDNDLGKLSYLYSENHRILHQAGRSGPKFTAPESKTIEALHEDTRLKIFRAQEELQNNIFTLPSSNIKDNLSKLLESILKHRKDLLAVIDKETQVYNKNLSYKNKQPKLINPSLVASSNKIFTLRRQISELNNLMDFLNKLIQENQIIDTHVVVIDSYLTISNYLQRFSQEAYNPNDILEVEFRYRIESILASELLELLKRLRTDKLTSLDLKNKLDDRYHLLLLTIASINFIGRNSDGYSPFKEIKKLKPSLFFKNNFNIDLHNVHFNLLNVFKDHFNVNLGELYANSDKEHFDELITCFYSSRNRCKEILETNQVLQEKPKVSLQNLLTYLETLGKTMELIKTEKNKSNASNVEPIYKQCLIQLLSSHSISHDNNSSNAISLFK